MKLAGNDRVGETQGSTSYFPAKRTICLQSRIRSNLRGGTRRDSGHLQLSHLQLSHLQLSHLHSLLTLPWRIKFFAKFNEPPEKPQSCQPFRKTPSG